MHNISWEILFDIEIISLFIKRKLIMLIVYLTILNFNFGTFILSYTSFLDEKISFSALLLPRRQHFLTRKFHFQHFYYLVDIISLGENFIHGNFIFSYTSFLDEKISFSTLLLTHFLTWKFYSLHSYIKC